MNVSDIIKRVRNIAGDLEVLQFTDNSIIAWVNDAMREIASDNQLLQKTAAQVTVPAVGEYALPDDILKFHSVLYEGNALRFVDLETAKSDGLFNDAQGVPVTCWVWAGKLILHPAPQDAGTLKLIYTRNPDEVAGPEDIPGIPPSYHMRLVDYCLAQVAQQDDDMNRYAMKMEEFRTGVQNLKDQPEWENNLYPMMHVSHRDGYEYGGFSDEY